MILADAILKTLLAELAADADALPDPVMLAVNDEADAEAAEDIELARVLALERLEYADSVIEDIAEPTPLSEAVPGGLSCARAQSESAAITTCTFILNRRYVGF